MRNLATKIVLITALITSVTILLVVIANILFQVEPAGHWFEIVGIIWATTFLLSEVLIPAPPKTH